MPWIHIHDVAGLFLHAAGTEPLNGPVNACAPNPVRNADFTNALGKIVRRPTILPVPAFILRAALRSESSLLLDSLRAIPEQALQSGFEFRFPELHTALADALWEKYGNSK
jgi:NAD dependent epimerase/dehydratase family enzyme